MEPPKHIHLSCKFPNCKNIKYKNENSSITFHYFPKGTVEQNIWKKLCFIDSNTKITSSFRICGVHFNDSDFQTGNKIKLKKSAVPSGKLQLVNIDQDQSNISSTSNSSDKLIYSYNDSVEIHQTDTIQISNNSDELHNIDNLINENFANNNISIENFNATESIQSGTANTIVQFSRFQK